MTAWHGGKGSSSRPRQVSNEEYANRWDAIFQRDTKPQEEEPVIEESEKEERDDTSKNV